MTAPKSLDELAREALPCVGKHGAAFCRVAPCDPCNDRPAVLDALKQAVEQEREACAKECERLFLDEFGETHEPIACAEAIRARRTEDR